MEYQDFLEKVKDSVQKRMGDNGEVRLASILKNNHNNVDTLTILNEGGNVAPAIYMAPYYQQYQSGETIERISDQILEFHRNHSWKEHYDLSFYTDFEVVRRRLVCRLVNYEKNREMLSQVPHKRFLDLAVIYYYKMEDDTFGDASILVKNEHMEMWNTDLDELDDVAMSNTVSFTPYECIYIADVIQQMTGIKIEEDEKDSIPMYVLTNTAKSFGAAVILYQTVLDAVSEKLGGDFYVLPSSVHECMLVPAIMDFKPAELREIVCEINEECVAEEEVLGDTVYRYCKEEGRLVTAASKDAA